MLWQSFLLIVIDGSLLISSQLLINVSKGTEQASVIQQRIMGNTTSDSVTIEFLSPGGDGVLQYTDFRTKATITVFTVPGEEDLGQFNYQVFCFITSNTGDMIPAEAVTKLRQKHPGTVRHAEEHRGTIVQDNPVRVNVSAASSPSLVSGQLVSLCREARDSTFSSLHELNKIIPSQKLVQKIIKSSSSSAKYESAKRCGSLVEDEEGDNSSLGGECVCILSSCTWWYPCSLKYCRNQSGEGEHRCGIRTCSKCFTHRYLANSRRQCSWDRNI